MKINEVIALTGEKLTESIAENNDTGCSAEDLTKIVESHRANQWDEAVDGDDYLTQLQEGKKPWQM